MNDINVTMTAFHGNDKPPSFITLIRSLLERISMLVRTESPGAFTPYDMYQIHTTLIGMETDFIDENLYGHWFFESWQKKVALNSMLFTKLLKNSIAMDSPAPLFTIRFGGFEKAYCTCADEAFLEWECLSGGSEFHSCGRSAYEGSFYAFAPGPAVFTGWPVPAKNRIDEFPHSLYLFRRAFEKAGFMDKYHSSEHPQWKDDDCYMKLGTFTGPVKNLSLIKEEMRDFLNSLNPITIEIHPKDVAVILYRDTSLNENAIIEKLVLPDILKEPGKLHMLFERLQEMKKTKE
ncbi:MAG: hypothetical protein JXB88_15010 [Spirochaetales bacterium]|nr:hypothetical protein [Spirochaetales bacterium]